MHTSSTTAQETLLEGLTERQREAVRHTDGPLLVLAGPGSGKTTVVTRRIAHLIASGVAPYRILALTFTNKAAAEMRDRIARLLPPDLPGVRGLTVATFHSFCARLLRRYAPLIGLAENYSIYDTGDQREAIKQALKIAGLDSKNWTPASVGSAISNAKNQLLDAKAFAAQANEFYTRSVAKVYTQYEKILRQHDAVDFDDLLLMMAKLIRDHEGVRTELQERFRYLMIDEYQDTNHAQFIIAHSLAAAHRNICVVGDPDQSIYGWRGADIRNIMEFEEHYSEASIVPLGQNFRSTGHIVKTADTLIRKNRQRKHKDLHTELEDGERPTVITCRDEHHEAQLIIEEFRKLREEKDIPWKEMAVLYRVNALSRVMEEAFRNAQIPYVIARGTAFYDRKEIKDALAYLRIITNPNDEVALKRIINTPTRGIGKTTLDRIEIYAIQNQLGLFDAMRQVDQISDLTARAVKAVQNFVSMIESWRAMEARAASSGEAMPTDDAPPHDEMLIPDRREDVADAEGEAFGGRTPFADLVERVVRDSGMEKLYRSAKVEEERERLDNLNELISAAAEFRPAGDAPGGEDPDREGDDRAGSILAAFLESVALVSDSDAIDPANGAVTLMTLHAAKGLEFDAVALAGLEEGLLPHSRSLENPSDIEEERRLCFVGITRARRHLLISHAQMRTQRGFMERTISSAFLDELPADAVNTLDLAGDPYGFSDFGATGGDVEDDRGGWGRTSGGFGSARKKNFPPRSDGGGGARKRDADDPFIDDVPAVEYGSWTPKSPSASTSRPSGGGGGVAGQFPVGCTVRHPKFGIGRVEGLTPRPAGTSARVNFRGLGVKTLILQYAKLERIE
ncbi:MAG: ATP-dependent DNA helicase PcrA [Phycisphaerales bacterium]|nr:MAG: ATP-dependent DNA helicase PcrA [Phycisphaerales bacterium]